MLLVREAWIAAGMAEDEIRLVGRHLGQHWYRTRAGQYLHNNARNDTIHVLNAEHPDVTQALAAVQPAPRH